LIPILAMDCRCIVPASKVDYPANAQTLRAFSMSQHGSIPSLNNTFLEGNTYAQIFYDAGCRRICRRIADRLRRGGGHDRSTEGVRQEIGQGKKACKVEKIAEISQEVSVH
jgi:hypothetical protein